MAKHRSSVNFQHLIRDLGEMYPFDISEVIVIELIANSLDAKANRIFIDYDPKKKNLVIQDDGRGMTPSQFEEYHDIAARLKPKGAGIGFAGLGAKVSFNIAERVITETRSKSLSNGSSWYLQSDRELVWEDIHPKHIRKNGTRVEVQFRPGVEPTYRLTDDFIRLLRRHYLPLLDLKFLKLYDAFNIYSNTLRFVINGKTVEPSYLKKELSLDKVKEFYPQRATKRFGYGIIGISESEYPISVDLCGVLLCTYGKVIKADLFNQFPGKFGPQLFGLVEIPEFVKFLTTNKIDFARKGKQRDFERLYSPVRDEFKKWLSSIGVESSEVLSSEEALEIERELKKLVEDIPELGDFFGFRSRKDVLKQDDKGKISSSMIEGVEITFPNGEGKKGEGIAPLDIGEEPGRTIAQDEEGIERARPISRKARRGPKIAFDYRTDRIELAWAEGNNIVINSGHPSHIKVQGNQKMRKLHYLFAVGSAIQRFLGSESEKPDMVFIDRMMAAWGKR